MGFTPTSTWSWLDHSVSCLQLHTLRPIKARFHYGSTLKVLNLACNCNSPALSTKSTRSRLNALPLLVSIWFQELFHSPLGVLFTFPSRYWFTIGKMGVFRLTKWSWQIPTKFHVLRRTQEHFLRFNDFVYGSITLCAVVSQPLLLSLNLITRYESPTTPVRKPVWPLPCSLAATKRIIIYFLFL